MSSYIERRRRRWYVKLTVPKDVRDALGTMRFVKSLETDSRSVAERRASPLIAKWKMQIQRARATMAGADPDPLLFEAKAWREALREANGDDEERDLILSRIEDIASDIDRRKDKGEGPARAFSEVATGQRVLLTEYLEEYLTANSTIRTDKTKAMVKTDVERMSQKFEYVADVTRKDVQRWATELMSANGATLKPKTVTRIVSACRGYWRYLQRIEIIPDELDPFANLEIARRGRHGNNGGTSPADSRQPFEPDDVVKLLNAASAKNDAILADLITLGMYTGCRIEELCSLRCPNVHVDHLEIEDAKTPAGWRQVPIHPKLKHTVKRLVDDSKDGYVLSGLTENKYGDRSNAIGKRFGRLKAEQGFDRRRVFHSIRKTVVTMLENKKVPEGVVADIVGHEKPTMTYGLYSGGSTMATKTAAIKKLAYPTTADSPTAT